MKTRIGSKLFPRLQSLARLDIEITSIFTEI